MTTATNTRRWKTILPHVNDNHALYIHPDFPDYLYICDLSGNPDTSDDGPLRINDEPATIDIFSNGNPGVSIRVFATLLQESSRVMTSRSVFNAIQAYRAHRGQQLLPVLRSPKAQAMLEALL